MNVKYIPCIKAEAQFPTPAIATFTRLRICLRHTYQIDGLINICNYVYAAAVPKNSSITLMENYTFENYFRNIRTLT